MKALIGGTSRQQLQHKQANNGEGLYRRDRYHSRPSEPFEQKIDTFIDGKRQIGQ